MAKPPPSGPHSDLNGVDRDAREGLPNRDPKKGTAADLAKAEKKSAGRPPNAGKMARDRSK